MCETHTYQEVLRGGNDRESSTFSSEVKQQTRPHFIQVRITFKLKFKEMTGHVIVLPPSQCYVPTYSISMTRLLSAILITLLIQIKISLYVVSRTLHTTHT